MAFENPAPFPSEPPPPPPPEVPRAETKGGRASAHEYLIASVRSALQRQLWIQGALYGGAAAVVLFALAGPAGHRAAFLGRALLIAAPIVACSIAGFFGLYLSARRVGSEARTARMLGEKLPELSLDLLAAVEIRRALERENGFSAELARAFLRQTDSRAAGQDPRRALDSRRTRLAALCLSLALAVSTFIVVFAPGDWLGGVTASLTSPPRAQQMRRDPITGDIELTYRYPAYSGLAPKTVPGTNGEVSALAGTEVQIKTRADRDVARADLVVNGKHSPLMVADARELSGSFVIDKPGSYQFVFFKSGDRKIAEGPPVSITVEPDDPPKVTLLSPAEDVEIDPGQKVILKYSVTDDYGLTSLELLYRTPRDNEDRRIPLRLDDERRLRGEYSWDLNGLKIAAGERISYYLAARDNDEVAGKKLGVSRTQYLKIYSASEHRRDAVRKAEVLWERLVTHLGNRLEGPDRAADKELEKIAGQNSVDQAGLEMASEMLQVAGELSHQRDSPEELWTALTNIAHGFQKRLRSTATLRRLFLRAPTLHGAELDPGKRLTRAVQDEIAETEKDVLYLESLLDRQKLQELKDMAKQLANDRRELASLIEQYKQTHDPKLQESILRQAAALKSRIGELMQRMAELAKGIRDEHFNAEALSHLLPEQDMRAELDNIERLMREGKADEALAKLQEMAQQMEEMLKGLENSDDQFGNAQYPELAAKFQQFMDELRQTTQEQKRLSDQTKEIRDRYKAETRQRLSQKGQALKDQLLKETEELQKDYRSVPPDQLNPRAEKPLEDVQRELENLRNSLKVEDYDLGAESASRAERWASELSVYAEQKRQLDEMYGGPPEGRAQSKQLAEKMTKNAQKIQEMNQKLQQLFPPPGAMLSEGDRDKLKEQSGEQRQLQKRAQGLQQRMDDIAQIAPVFGDDATEQMEQIGRRMGEASQRIEAKDPGRGYSEQKAALEQLQRFQQQMKEAQSKGKGGRGLPMPMYAGSRSSGFGGNASREKVEIPAADQAPKEFRKDLLDAMKQGAPEKYKDQVKRYYEELVK